jgi:hypothetical protein
MRTYLKSLPLFTGIIILLLLFILPVDFLHEKAYAQTFAALPPSGGEDTTACLPDCFNSPFSSPKLHKVLIPGYGWFLIKYRTRYACNTWYDVYIDWIVPLNTGGVDPMASKSMQFILEIVTNFLLKDNPMQFPPLPGTNPPCWTNWRVIKGGCWSRTNTGSPPCPIQYVPCNEQQCCLEPYEVCVNVSTGERTVRKIPYGWSPYSCSPYVSPNPQQPCEPACGSPSQYVTPQN